jgi:hypothetical protein
MYKTIDFIREAGFTGFYSVARLRLDNSIVPAIPGIYLIVQPTDDTPVFLPKGTGGFFKGRDPNLPVAELTDKWLEECKILYVGKAGGSSSKATLRSRLKQYLDFGNGKPVGHYGGRLIWQLKHHSELLVAWRAMSTGSPRTKEKELIGEIATFYGRRPFANLAS